MKQLESLRYNELDKNHGGYHTNLEMPVSFI